MAATAAQLPKVPMIGKGSKGLLSRVQKMDAASNPTLARVCSDEKLPNFEEGEHYQAVALESGAERRDLPVWTSFPGAIKLEPKESLQSMRREEISGVNGGFVIHNVCTRGECDQMVKLSESMGYTEDAPVSLARHIRQNENCVWLADKELCDTLFERVKPFLPKEVAGGEAGGMNARWRLYKYGPQDIFKIHTDGSWPGSGLDERGRIVRDVYGDRWSQLTIVFYLNDEFEGGPTRFFFPTDRDANTYRTEEARAGVGGAVCFFHGEHPLSPLHEGGLVTKGTKYIIRSDLLYKLAPRGGNFQEQWIARYANMPDDE
mmetsp:Transcript_38023/g.80512  ORF Transcript_38023/g.80512 Transcript_38023/m.80512 type:complete len:318 (+) Transcript_38023:272-1225(+)|eukprot:CAMPEP_0206458730 /NCGR_PEP_ID=MMETSP0324_2-20121206/23746_1 /ASSEMBLY_ACC=CAM_ASM_000836 /TAXON_ID=2866 /ORGANISM="Crypthecodinium cohnii, Strain Seligo" /LENGTH=317 /DNA_ID=CAMNT_0053930129 /DNA_START=252 /DNA_END=1205 /DNA_ORIENTATION=-